MKMFKSTVVVTAVALLGLGVAAPAPTAQAGSALCTGTTKACVYLDAGYNGLFGTKNAGAGLSNISTENNDKMSSWENKSSTNGAWYYDANGLGTCKDMYAQSEKSYQWLDGINDNMSSWRMNGHC